MPSLKIPSEFADVIKETSESHRSQIRKFSDDAFKDHVLEKISDDGGSVVWYASKPKTGFYHFYVAFVPHAIIVYGDIGDMLLRPGWNRGLEWLVESTHDGNGKHLGYLLEKSMHRDRHQEFMPGDVIEMLIDHAKDAAGPDEFKQYQDLIDTWAETECYGMDGRNGWYEAASDAGMDSEWYGGFSDYTSERYWCAYALCWFVREWIKRGTEGERQKELRDAEAGV